MNVTMFLTMLSAFSAVSSLVTECIKNLAADKADLPCNIVALITALIIGSGGTAVYYQLNAVSFTADSFIYMILMGLASGLVSMAGFDKVKQTIGQIVGSKV